MAKVLIAGGGVAGLSVMGFLRGLGYEVSLVEKAESLRAQGAGLLLGINAMKILSELGVAEQVIASGQVLKSVKAVDKHGKEIGNTDAVYMEAQTGYKTVAIHRTALHSILSESLPNEEIHLGATVSRLENTEHGVKVTFSDDSCSDYDLMIAADGIYSETRKLLQQGSQLRYAGYTCWRFVIDRPESIDAHCGQEYWGTGRRFGVFPLGENKLYCFATLNAAENDVQYKNLNVERFKELYAEFGGSVPEVLRSLSQDDVLIHGDLRDQQQLLLQQKNVVILGDAAHAATPNMGQGAAMALEDAYVLSECLKNESAISLALQAYEQRRAARVKQIRDRSYIVGKIGQWESSLASSIRNSILRILPKRGLSKDLCKLLMDY